eukprot:CAMPEP_0113571976 /NCGR_PEP_ID=MMETSP0015_2-20120614/25848_1 /TAXON_ID=2838 /ORGANISM="Odontella" /LENGTH=141 /DNA_ID=CAMNT_0000474977 /DNA_START=750 /DNA_END=1176 /DNA_ORIENTATION=+ /assembly_acc=CAM_ASM_000160
MVRTETPNISQRLTDQSDERARVAEHREKGLMIPAGGGELRVHTGASPSCVGAHLHLEEGLVRKGSLYATDMRRSIGGGIPPGGIQFHITCPMAATHQPPLGHADPHERAHTRPRSSRISDATRSGRGQQLASGFGSALKI